MNNRSKHIDTHYHHVREQLEAGTFDLMYVPTKDNLADLFTSAVTPISYVQWIGYVVARRNSLRRGGAAARRNPQ